MISSSATDHLSDFGQIKSSKSQYSSSVRQVVERTNKIIHKMFSVRLSAHSEYSGEIAIDKTVVRGALG